jgi:hypothetical protein
MDKSNKKAKLEEALRQNLLRRKESPREGKNPKRETIINPERNKEGK